MGADGDSPSLMDPSHAAGFLPGQVDVVLSELAVLDNKETFVVGTG